jgi:hypothetical protein
MFDRSKAAMDVADCVDSHEVWFFLTRRHTLHDSRQQDYDPGASEENPCAANDSRRFSVMDLSCQIVVRTHPVPPWVRRGR